MAKKPETPLDSSELQRAVAAFTKQTDRGSALIATAWLEDALSLYIRAKLRPDKKTIDDVIRPEGPLGTFSSKIKLAYLFGFIDTTAHDDLETIRKIRNEFAHVRDQIRFSDKNVKDKCKQLSAVKALELGGLKIRSPRQMFLVTCYFLTEYLLTLTQGAKSPAKFEIGYSVPLRRLAKAATLEKALKSFDIGSG
jgi:DNA-binding MltR family transcriptional regulator